MQNNKKANCIRKMAPIWDGPSVSGPAAEYHKYLKLAYLKNFPKVGGPLLLLLYADKQSLIKEAVKSGDRLY